MSDVLIVKRPVVANTAQKTPVAAAATMLAMVGLGVFFWLSSARAANADREDSLPALAATTATDSTSVVPAAPVVLQASTPAPPPMMVSTSGPVPMTTTPTQSYSPPSFPAQSGIAPVPTIDPMIERMRAPALVIDFAQANIPRQPGSPDVRSDSGDDQIPDTLPPIPGAAQGAGSIAAGVAARINDRNLSDTERFAARVGGEEAGSVEARRMRGLSRLVPQGAVVGAVMETALNSDQPGFARALVQRDVYSFDGSSILIPAGSRLIGQYKSGVAQGASRLFVLWTRLIRPDGVSIELASPATDDLGRGGIGGKVNRHFLQRFGGAILTSVLSGGISAATASLAGGSAIIVGNAGQASSLATQATQSADIPPTITTRQGALVRVFVARDLDFSRVGPAR